MKAPQIPIQQELKTEHRRLGQKTATHRLGLEIPAIRIRIQVGMLPGITAHHQEDLQATAHPEEMEDQEGLQAMDHQEVMVEPAVELEMHRILRLLYMTKAATS